MDRYGKVQGGRRLVRSYVKRPVKRAIALYGKEHPGFRKAWKRLLYQKRRFYYRIRSLNVKPDERTVVFNSFNGKSYGCSPRAIYEYMLSHREFDGWTFIWAFRDVEKHRFLEQYPNTRVIPQTAQIYERYLAGGKVLDHQLPAAGTCMARPGSGVCSVLARHAAEKAGI